MWLVSATSNQKGYLCITYLSVSGLVWIWRGWRLGYQTNHFLSLRLHCYSSYAWSFYELKKNTFVFWRVNFIPSSIASVWLTCLHSSSSSQLHCRTCWSATTSLSVHCSPVIGFRLLVSIHLDSGTSSYGCDVLEANATGCARSWTNERVMGQEASGGPVYGLVVVGMVSG